MLINSVCNSPGIDQNVMYDNPLPNPVNSGDTALNYSGATHPLSYYTSPLRPMLAPGEIIFHSSCHDITKGPRGPHITWIDFTNNIVHLSAGLRANCAAGNTIEFGTNDHPDAYFLYIMAAYRESDRLVPVNVMYENTSCTIYCNAEGIFTYGGPAFDLSYVNVNTDVYNPLGSGFQSLNISTSMTNGYFYGDTFNGASTAWGDIPSDTTKDVYNIGSTFGTAQSIKRYFSGTFINTYLVNGRCAVRNAFSSLSPPLTVINNYPSRGSGNC